MTRINIVEPSELSDQHLVAEYREIFHVGSALQRTLASPNRDKLLEDRPTEFTLNKGHTKFFFDKGKYLYKRYSIIVKEMKTRGMKPDPDRFFKKFQFPEGYFNDWEPTDKDLELIRERIKVRIEAKKDWYRWTKSESVE